MSAHSCFYSSVSAHTCPFRQPGGWHFPRQAGTAFKSHTFIFPTRGDRSRLFFFSFVTTSIQYCLQNAIHSCRHSWAAGRTEMSIRRKEYTMTLSEESGIGESQNAYLTPVSFAWILHSTPYFFILVFPTAFYDRSRMTGRYLVTFRKKLFFRFCSRLPLPTAPPPPSP